MTVLGAFLPGLGVPELLIILVIVLLLFGPKKLPEIGKALGSGIRELKKGAEGKDEESAKAKEKSKEETKEETKKEVKEAKKEE